MLNREYLIKVRNVIISHATNFRYTDWRVGKPKDILEHKCGTCACVAGFTEILYIQDNPEKDIYNIDVRDILGVTWDESEFLFYCHALDDIPQIQLSEATYRDAIQRIDHLLKKDGYDISTLSTVS
jgi:hypothetical protein